MDILSALLQQAHQRAAQWQLAYAGAFLPQEACQFWQQSPANTVQLIDVRTKAEQDWVGRVPGALEIEWMLYPECVPNPDFLQQLTQCCSLETTILFLCRSGARSDAAARRVTQAGFSRAYNILEGFEGDKNPQHQRNRVNGWRFAGLPWLQS